MAAAPAPHLLLTAPVLPLLWRLAVPNMIAMVGSAVAAIAETGTVVLTETDTSSRLAALAPWVHVAIVKRAQIFIDVPQAVAALPQDPNIIWCTGPSKTADVEGILIEGVHGPGEQIALVL